tara:strand:- start:1691 stop:1948 length:258 start_codon:yes stop_codon:yes gene_type:complete
MSLNLKKTINDNVNSAEAKQSEKVLEKVKIAYRYNKAQFMDKINKSTKTELRKMLKSLETKYKKTKDADEMLILGGQIAEINKLI